MLRSLTYEKDNPTSAYIADTDASQALNSVIEKLEQETKAKPAEDSSNANSNTPVTEPTSTKTKSIMIFNGQSVFEKTVTAE